MTTGASGRGADPLGKRALFWWPEEHPAVTQAEVDAHPVLGRGSIAVECPACKVRSRVGVLDFLLLQLPVGVWLPRGRYAHRMTCPSCRHRVWASVSLRPR